MYTTCGGISFLIYMRAINILIFVFVIIEGNVAKQFMYRDTDPCHGNSEFMILYNDYKHYCTTVPGFLLDSSICEEAEDVEKDTYFLCSNS